MKTLEQLTINSYQLEFLRVASTGEVIFDVTLERCTDSDGASNWAICDRGLVLNKSGEWERPRLPSNREDDFYARCRWTTPEVALQFWQTGNCKPSNYENMSAFMKEHPELFPTPAVAEQTPIVYTLINPSDEYTIKANDFEVAAIACCILGEGMYGLRQIHPEVAEEARLEVPMLPVDGHDEWFLAAFGVDFRASAMRVVETKKQALIEVMEGLLLGGLDERVQFEQGLEQCASDTERNVFRFTWHDRHRCSSMNDIGGQARRFAAMLRSES